MKKVLQTIISNEPTDFLPGRFIGENIRTALDAIEFTNKTNQPGLLLFADFEKAFDKIECSFILKALRFFNFGADLINWISLLYNNISSCVINNGYTSDFFKVSCGVRQGCPLRPMLFVM